MVTDPLDDPPGKYSGVPPERSRRLIDSPMDEGCTRRTRSTAADREVQE